MSSTSGKGHCVTCSWSIGWSVAKLGFEPSPCECLLQLPFLSRTAGHTHQLPFLSRMAGHTH